MTTAGVTASSQLGLSAFSGRGRSVGRMRRVRVRRRFVVVLVLLVVLALTPGVASSITGLAGGDDARDARVVLLGDSVTEQAFGYEHGDAVGDGAPGHLDRWSHVGWTVREAVDHADHAELASADTDVVVVALGPNDAAPWQHGWRHDDVVRWRALLAMPDPGTCVAIVLPGWKAPVRGTAWARSMQHMRADVERLASARETAGSPTITVDWQPVVERHPEYLAVDGIHLAPTAAARARQELYWNAVARCREG